MVDTPLPLQLENTQEPAPQPLPLPDGSVGPAPMTEQRAQRVAFNTVFGQNKKDPDYRKTYDEVYAALTSGQEDTVRQEIATRQDAENALQTQRTITDLMSKTTAPVNALQVQLAISALTKKPVDPATVVEKDYGYQYIAELDRMAQRNPLAPYTIYTQYAPQDAIQLKSTGSTLVGQRQITIDAVERAKARLEKQSWGFSDIFGNFPAIFGMIGKGPAENLQNLKEYRRNPDDGFGGYIADQLKPVVNPFYNDMKLRGLVNGRWFSGFGTNLVQTQLEQEIFEINQIRDLPEYKRRVDELVDRVGDDNPALAVQIAEAFHGRATSTVNLDNAFNIADLSIIAGGIARAGRGIVNFARNLSDINVARRAARDVVRSTESTEPPAVAMAQGAGDTQEAGIQKAVDLLQKDDIQKQADALTSHLKTNQIFITTDRGPPPVEVGNTRYYFGGDLGSAEKTGYRSFDDATNFGAAEHIHFVDVPKPAKGEPPASIKLTPEQQTALVPYETRPAHSNNYRELATRLVNTAQGFIGDVQRAILEMSRVERIPALLKVEAAMRAVTEDLKGALPSLSDHIIDVTVPKKNAITNSYDYSYHLGQKGARHFEDRATAEEWGRLRLGNIQHTVEGEGSTFYVKVTKPLPLNADIVRDGLLASDSALFKERGAFKSYFSRFRTPDEILSKDHRENRKLAVYSAAIYQELRRGQEKFIQDLRNGVIKDDPVTGESFARLKSDTLNRAWYFENNKLGAQARLKRLEEFNRTLDAAKSLEHPVTGDPGYWFRNIGELEDFYQTHFQHRPDRVTIEAYFAQKNLSDLDHALRNWRVVTNMRQNGVQQFRLNSLSPDGKNFIQSQWFDGITQSKLPSGDEAILVLGDHLEDSKVGVLNKSGPKFTNDARKAVEKGEATVIRLWMPEKNPLLDYGVYKPEDGMPVYVLVKTGRHEVKDIAWEQVPYKEGGHFVYDAEHYIKQANVVHEKIGNVFRRRYYGDATIMPMKIRAMAEDVADKLDNFRALLLAKDEDGAKAYLRANPIGVDYDEVRGWFNKKKNLKTGVVEPPMLNKTEKIQVVRKNENIWDRSSELRDKYPKGPGEIEDGRKSSLATQYSVEFTGQRDANNLKTVVNEGTVTNPLYKYVDAEFMDPIPTLQRSLNRIINSTFLDDYKQFAVEHWIQAAAGSRAKGGFGVMRNTIDEFRSAPMYFFHYGEFRPDAPIELVRNFEAQREAIKGLLRQETAWTKSVNAIYDDLTDHIYLKDNLAGKFISQGVADWMLPIMQDPVGYFRKIAFHAKLGLYSVPQLLVQSASYVNMYAIAGARPATLGSAAATLRIYDAINPAHRAFLDAQLAKVRLPGFEKYWWKPGEFTEATELLERTGFGHVQNEVSYLGNKLIESTIKNQTQQFLDAGTWFFRMGEKNTRHGAWYIAYKEFRAKNPTGKITETDLRSILDRADLLSGNMSRASSSILHQGVLSATTQFMAYQMRMTEQLTGTRLTRWEKGRLVATNAAIYGVPAASGLSGIPYFGDKARELMIENGYIPGQHWYSTLLGEGLISMLGTLITGTPYNVGNRFGNWGYEQIREVYREDGDILKAVGGAPYSLVANSISNLDPFFKWVQAEFKGEKFNIQRAHVLDVMSELAGPNNFRKTLVAMNTQKYLSNRGLYLDDTSPTKALFMGLTGLKDVRIDDIRHYKNINDEMDEMQKKATQGYMREYQRGLQALSDKDPELAQEYFDNAKFYAIGSGLSPTREMQIFKQTVDANRPLISKIDWRFYGEAKNVPPGKEELYATTYRNIQQMREQQGKTHD